jgi:hypothetical protein
LANQYSRSKQYSYRYPPKGRAPNPLAALEFEIELEFKSEMELADALFACCTDTGRLGGTVRED